MWVMAPTSWPLRVALLTVSRLLPLTVTTLPTVAAGGVKLVMVGSRMTVKLLLLVPVPPGLVTAILPVVAVGGMSAWMVLSSLTWKLSEATPLKVTLLAPVKLLPLIWTLWPRMSAAGAKPLILGVTRRVAALGLLGPAGFVTVSLPLLAPVGMVNLS